MSSSALTDDRRHRGARRGGRVGKGEQPSSLSDLRLMDELRRGFFTPPVLVLVLLCGS